MLQRIQAVRIDVGAAGVRKLIRDLELRGAGAQRKEDRVAGLLVVDGNGRLLNSVSASNVRLLTPENVTELMMVQAAMPERRPS